MNIKQKPLVENYILEIVSRSKSVQKDCKELLSLDFISKCPEFLLITISNCCDFLMEAVYALNNSIKWEENNLKEINQIIVLFKDIDSLIRELGSHVRYAYGATSSKIPWNSINSFEKYIDQLLPGTKIMLSPQWKYNYSIVPFDLYEIYYKTLYEFQDYVPDFPLDKVLESLPKHFYLVSFPSIEKNNILLHCLIGHEIGHLYVKNYFTDEVQKQFFLTIQPEISKVSASKLKSKFPSMQDELFYKQSLQMQIQYDLDMAFKYWKRGVEEILSDIIGTFLFGPAVLFSTLEITLQNELDIAPQQKSNFYPPWRMRLRELLEIIENPDRPFSSSFKKFKFSDKTKNAVSNIIEIIKDISKEDSDQKAILNDPIRNIAYVQVKEHIKNAKKHFKDKLKDKIIEPKSLLRDLPELIERIDNGIPPNAYEEELNNRRPATLIEIINAAWFHKISWDFKIFSKKGKVTNEAISHKNKMNRLTLKAVEYSDVELSYREKLGSPDNFDPSENQ